METENKKPKTPFAFPLNFRGYNENGRLCEKQEFGMTLRDYFAAKAMQGLMSDTSSLEGELGKVFYVEIAKASYLIADAMIKQRDI